MKKFTVLILLGLFIMVCGCSLANAQALEFKASGLVTTTAYWYQNIPTGGTAGTIIGPWDAPFQPTDPPPITRGRDGRPVVTGNDFANFNRGGAWNRPNAYLQSRMNLVFDASIGKELNGRLALEIDAMRWGTNPGEDGAGRTGRWRADANGIEVKHAYFDAALPYFGIPVPMTIRLGLQPLGYRPHILMISDGMGLTGGIKIDPVMIAPMWGKPIEGKDTVADDVDVVGLQTTVKLGTLSFGGYGIYWNCNTYPLNQAPASFGGGPGNQLAAFGVTPIEKADFWWAGVFLDGKAGPVNLQFDGIMDRGEVQRRHNFAPARDVTYRGWLGRLKVEYPWQKVSFGAVGMYATGADLHQTGPTGRPGEIVANARDSRPNVTSRKVSSFVVPPGSEQAGITGDDFFVFGNFVTLEAAPLNMAPASGVLTNVVHRGAYGGLWFLKAFAGYKVTPWYKVTVEALYIGDTTKAGNTFGNAVTTDRTRKLKDDDDVGWEFNLINEVNIYKNLKWDLGAGYLIAGDALDMAVANNTNAVRFNKSPHNPWIVASKLRYTF